jgi:2-polyprenyl-6-methoxyphenol hydroxylase-like FAD-dependent oxidoreductase
MPDFDVIIVGGRPAGAALAAHLGAAGRSVLIVDRDTFPCLPGVPSSPVIHQSTMRLLDELGIAEERYGLPDDRVRSFHMTLEGAFSQTITVPEFFGRDYLYGVDRKSFDFALWENLKRYPSVTRKDAFSVTGLQRDAAGRISGIIGHDERFSARWVIGADGRYSMVSHWAGGRVVDDRTRWVSTVYYADWENMAKPEGLTGATAQMITNGAGTNVLCVPGPRGLMSVNAYVRADLGDFSGKAEDFYNRIIDSQPAVRARLKNAKQVGPLVGIKRVSNRYRSTGGPGWMLVGDAWHCKDPVDGQGIYDALTEAKVLAPVLVNALAGQLSDAAAVAAYERDALAATQAMFEETVKRIKRELYGKAPNAVVKRMMRYMMGDPAYQHRFMSFLCRAIEPKGWMKPSIVAGALARGMWRDLRG